MNPSPKVKRLAEAISVAEGFPVAGSLPQRTHNPGDLEIGDVGHGVDAGKTIFPDDAAGWNALYHQCSLMLYGGSHVYKPSMTFLEVAKLYTGGDNWEEWANIVAHGCQVGADETLEDYLNLDIVTDPELGM